MEKIEPCKRNYGLPKKTVIQYDLQGNQIKKYESANEAARQTGFASGNICSCCNGKRKSTNGYMWRYEQK